MVGRAAVAWDVAGTKAAAGNEGGGGHSCHLNFQGVRTMRANRYIEGGGAKFSSI
jgi:hypothetical protein